MRTTTMKQCKEKASERTIIVHVFRVPVSGASRSNIYYMACATGHGDPIGIVTTSNGENLRQWSRLAAVEEVVAAALKDQLISINVYPVECAEPEVLMSLVKLYELNKAAQRPNLNAEREGLLKALTKRRRRLSTANGRASDPADT